MSNIKISNLRNNCAIMDECHRNVDDEEDLFRLLKCLSTRVPSDILTIQASIITNLFLRDGKLYDKKYCSFFYEIYMKFINRYKQEELKIFLEKYRNICYDFSDSLLQIKNTTIYRNIQDNIFINSLADLGIIFVLLEFANSLSSYGNEHRSSLVDKMNQILVYKDEEFKFRTKKVNTTDHPNYLPPFYTDDYTYGCNCLCNSIFVITMFRILATNGRLGLPYDPNMIRNINAFSDNVNAPGHSFLGFQIDKGGDISDFNNSLYIECTLNFDFGPVSIIHMNDDRMVSLILKNLEKFIKTSSLLYHNYNTNMYNVPNDQIYINVIDDFLANLGSKATEIALSVWPSLMDSEIMIHHKIAFDEHLDQIEVLILILKLFERFPNAVNIWKNYYNNVLSIFQHSDSLNLILDERYSGTTLRSVLRRWKPRINNTMNREIYGWIREQISKLSI
jgi:hypothetical protein